MDLIVELTDNDVTNDRVVANHLIGAPKKMKVTTVEGEFFRDLFVPAYSLAELPKLNCSAYVRKAAKELFNKTYSTCHAWDRRYFDKLMCDVGGRDLESLVEEEILKPGMVIGTFIVGSGYRDREDCRGDGVKYTHNMLYLGRDIRKKPIFAQQVGSITSIVTEKEVEDELSIPMEVIDSRY